MADSHDPYEQVTSDALGQRAAQQMSYRFDPADDPGDVIISGPCPRCGGEMTFTWPLMVVRSLLAAAPSPTLEITVICRCAGAHSGAGSETGCGAYWNLTVPRPA